MCLAHARFLPNLDEKQTDGLIWSGFKQFKVSTEAFGSLRVKLTQIKQFRDFWGNLFKKNVKYKPDMYKNHFWREGERGREKERIQLRG